MDPETGLFRTEYADIMRIDGLNFADGAKPAPIKPPRPVVAVHAVRPERDHLEITFPRVVGYRTDLPSERIDVDLSAMEPYVLTPEKVGGQWLASDRVRSNGGTRAGQLLYRQLTDEVCDLLMNALVDRPGGESVIRTTLDPFAPEGSTADVNFTTDPAPAGWRRLCRHALCGGR